MQLMASEQKLVFSDNRCATVLMDSVLPGMLQSVKDLIILSTSERRNFNWGFVTSAIILGGHAGELLLKYKLEREGKSFDEIHDLYKLYQQLENESKEAIQIEFGRLLSEAEKPPAGMPGWDSAESVIKSARLAHVESRYLIERTPKKPRQSPAIDPELLYTAVLSIYRTTPLKHSKTISEPIAIEHLPPDVRAIVLKHRS